MAVTVIGGLLTSRLLTLLLIPTAYTLMDDLRAVVRGLPARAPPREGRGRRDDPRSTPEIAALWPALRRSRDRPAVALRPEGYRIVTAGDGDAALALARAERPVVILCDWHMPGRTGLEVCAALREDSDPALREVPFVLLTAQTGAENTAAGFAAGVTDYLTRPFTPAHVRTRVRAWLLRAGNGR